MRALVAEWSGREVAIEPAIDETEAEQLRQQVALLQDEQGWTVSDVYAKAGLDQDKTKKKSTYSSCISTFLNQGVRALPLTNYAAVVRVCHARAGGGVVG
jgi:hypothetical protein